MTPGTTSLRITKSEASSENSRLLSVSTFISVFACSDIESLLLLQPHKKQQNKRQKSLNKRFELGNHSRHHQLS